MKTWIKWLEKSGYDYEEWFNVIDECRIYDFGNGLLITKWENKNGGLIDNNGFTICCGSNKMLQQELNEILG